MLLYAESGRNSGWQISQVTVHRSPISFGKMLDIFGATQSTQTSLSIVALEIVHELGHH